MSATIVNEGDKAVYIVCLGPKGAKVRGPLHIMVVMPGASIAVFGEWKYGRPIEIPSPK